MQKSHLLAHKLHNPALPKPSRGLGDGVEGRGLWGCMLPHQKCTSGVVLHIRPVFSLMRLVLYQIIQIANSDRVDYHQWCAYDLMLFSLLTLACERKKVAKGIKTVTWQTLCFVDRYKRYFILHV